MCLEFPVEVSLLWLLDATVDLGSSLKCVYREMIQISSNVWGIQGKTRYCNAHPHQPTRVHTFPCSAHEVAFHGKNLLFHLLYPEICRIVRSIWPKHHSTAHPTIYHYDSCSGSRSEVTSENNLTNWRCIEGTYSHRILGYIRKQFNQPTLYRRARIRTQSCTRR